MAECGQVILSPVAHFQQILSLDSKQLGGVMFVSHFHEIEVSWKASLMSTNIEYHNAWDATAMEQEATQPTNWSRAFIKSERNTMWFRKIEVLSQ